MTSSSRLVLAQVLHRTWAMASLALGQALEEQMISYLIVLVYGPALYCDAVARCSPDLADSQCEVRVLGECDMNRDQCLFDADAWVVDADGFVTDSLTVYGCENAAQPRLMDAGWVP